MKKKLVLVHGWGMNNAVWQSIIPQLEKQYEVFLVSLPGHDQDYLNSNIPTTLTDWATYVLQKAPDKAHWLGWSLGGEVVLKAASLAPERFEKCFIMTSTPCFMQQENWQSAMPEINLTHFSKALFQRPNKTLERFLLLQVRGCKNESQIYVSLKKAFEIQPEPNLQALKIGLKLLKNTDLRPLIQNLTLPIYWLFGSKDTLVPATCAEALAQLLPTYQGSVITKSGHAPFLSHPQQTLDLIHCFFNDHV